MGWPRTQPCQVAGCTGRSGQPYCESHQNECLDCGKRIGRKSLRCQPCSGRPARAANQPGHRPSFQCERCSQSALVPYVLCASCRKGTRKACPTCGEPIAAQTGQCWMCRYGTPRKRGRWRLGVLPGDSTAGLYRAEPPMEWSCLPCGAIGWTVPEDGRCPHCHARLLLPSSARQAAA